MVKRRIGLCALIAWLSLPLLPLEAGASAEAEEKEWRFRVLLDDKEIGTHRFRVTGSGERKTVEIDARFDVRFLFFNAYSYRHDNQEHWEGACLRQIRSTTQAGKKQYRIEGQALPGQFALETHAGATRLDSDCVRSFAYWDPAILQSERLLNAQSGEWLDVTVEEAGPEVLEVLGREVRATRYALKLPEGVISLWYGPGGHWLALEAPAPGGRVLRYLPEHIPAPFRADGELASR